MTNALTNAASAVAEVTNMTQTVDSLPAVLTTDAINMINMLAANQVAILVIVLVVAAILIFKK